MKKTVRINLKPEGLFEPQLVLCEAVLPGGGEWLPQLPGWLVIYVSTGVGYWMNPRMNHELQPGSVLLLSDQVKGCVRASQVGEMCLRFFRFEPAKLTGMVTMAEQAVLQNAARDEKLSMRALPPADPFSEKFKRLLNAKEFGNSFPMRAQLLLFFLEVFGGRFEPPQVEQAAAFDAGVRLRQMLNQLPVAELIDLSFSDLVNKTGCSSRHVSRLFTEMVGVSFREKQVELRLTRACELLATSDFKVMDVALESGYQSTSLFNLIFKQRFGVSPGRWRDQAKKRKPVKEVVRLARAAA